MRHFGRKTPKYMEFTLGDDETIYKMPLAASMSADMVEKYEPAFTAGEHRFQAQVDMLRDFLGDIAGTLTSEEIAEILTAWAEESQSQGASVGES
ncbi:MAG: hypothetical protein IJJ45_02990 [Clostridia bacterium]|nr:hypothetical protein [Clostridia bacterium]